MFKDQKAVSEVNEEINNLDSIASLTNYNEENNQVSGRDRNL